MEENDIDVLCRKIYKRHKAAIDLIFERKPDHLNDIKDYVESLVLGCNEPKLVSDHTTKNYIRFGIKSWDQSESQMKGEGWTKSNRLLLFEFQNSPDGLVLKLLIGPGDSEVREQIFRYAQDNSDKFLESLKTLRKKWSQVYKKTFLDKKDYEDFEQDEVFEKISNCWGDFIRHDIEELEKALPTK